jgi:hypothetical protein
LVVTPTVVVVVEAQPLREAREQTTKATSGVRKGRGIEAKRRTSNVERRTSNVERRMTNVEWRLDLGLAMDKAGCWN